MAKIKVLETIRQGKIGGGEKHVLEITKRINRDLFDVEVLSFTDGEMIEELKKYNIKSYVVPNLKPFNLFIWDKVYELIKSKKYDIIHSHGTRAFSNCFFAAGKAKIPKIYTVHGWSFHPDQNFVVRQLRLRSEKFLTQRSNLNILVSSCNQKEGFDRLNLKNSLVVKNGVDLKHFCTNRSEDVLRKEIPSLKGKKLIGLIARLTGQKDPFTFLRSAEKIISSNDNVDFIIVGGGDLENNCMEWVKDKNLTDSIHFLGFRNDIANILRSLDIFCLPSLWEGLPIGLLEAMAMNKCVIVSDIQANKELVTDNVNGLIFKVKDENDLTQKILEVINNDQKRIQLGERARIFIEENHDINTMINSIEDIYKKYHYNNEY